MSNRRHDSQAGERLTKQVIVFTMCAIAFMVTATICRNSWAGTTIPEQLSQLSTLIIGIVGGWLGKTGVDAIADRRSTDPQVPEGGTVQSFTTSSATVTTATDGGDDEVPRSE